MTKLFRLKAQMVMEPLIHHWYASPLLISPATAAMVTANLHLPMLESFVKAPAIHRAAVKNPALRGGPFVDYEGPVQDIDDLIRSTKVRMSRQLRLASAIRELEDLVRRDTHGASLAPLYDSIPCELKGFVELGYDLSNHASIRFIDGLLYRSEYFDTSLQSIRLSPAASDNRPFVVSTPRLECDDALSLNVPFASGAVDALSRLRTSPADERQLEQLIEGPLALSASRRDRFLTYFTECDPEPPADDRRNPAYNGSLRVRYFGHATVLLETPQVSIMTDPAIAYGLPDGVPRYSFADLPDQIDYVLLTHAHQDHVALETLLQIRWRVRCWIVPKSSGGALQDPSLKQMLMALGFKNVVELDEAESLEIPGGELTGWPFLGEHGDLQVRSKLAFHVRLERTTFLFLADSNVLDPVLYDHMHRHTGDVDHLFIGMECDGAPMSWLYGPLLTQRTDRRYDESRRLNGSNCDRAMCIVRRLHPKSVHVYAMGQEPWLTHISSIAYTAHSAPIVESDKLLAQCRDLGIPSERLYGRKTVLDTR